jgi:threonine dehydrogenase-like Zn-dependent dehydrogenase
LIAIMLALYFDRQPAIKTLPRPEPAPGEVLVRVSMAGICGTDLQVLRGYHNFQGVMGHEFVGEVAGPKDSTWLGQRVVGEINITCGECDRCRLGLTRHCRQRRILGLKEYDGALAQYLTLPAANLHAVPPEVPDVWAVFTETLAAAMRVLETAPVSPESRVLIVGDGRLGLLISWVLALSGVEVHLAGHHAGHLAFGPAPGGRHLPFSRASSGRLRHCGGSQRQSFRAATGLFPGPASGHSGCKKHLCRPLSPGSRRPGGSRGAFGW